MQSQRPEQAGWLAGWLVVMFLSIHLDKGHKLAQECRLRELSTEKGGKSLSKLSFTVLYSRHVRDKLFDTYP